MQSQNSQIEQNNWLSLKKLKEPLAKNRNKFHNQNFTKYFNHEHFDEKYRTNNYCSETGSKLS